MSESSEEEVESENEILRDLCCKCNKPYTDLKCAICSRRYHKNCVEFEGDKTFYCDLCHADSCYACHKSGGVILCDYCYCYYHLECVPIMPGIFESDWCPECYSELEIEKIVSWRPMYDEYQIQHYYQIKKKELVDKSLASAMKCVICKTDALTEPIIMCEGCSRSVHLSCEGLKEVPEDDWYCDNCVNNGYDNPDELLPWEYNNTICHYCRRINTKCLKCSDCNIYYCQNCLSDIFPLSRDYISAYKHNNNKNQSKWKCLKCRKLCYCYFCLKDRIKEWKNEVPDIPIPESDRHNQYLIKWKSKSYSKCTWVKESYFKISTEALQMFKLFYFTYVNFGLVPSIESYKNYCKIEKIIKQKQNVSETNDSDDYDIEGCPLYEQYIVKWEGLGYDDLSEEYFIDILPFISEIEQYNNVQKNNKNRRRSINVDIEKPIHLCQELTEYQKYDVMKLIWMYENNINGLVCYEYGLGVRVMLISYINILIKNNHIPILIIASDEAVNKWKRDIKYWSFGCNVSICKTIFDSKAFYENEYKQFQQQDIIIYTVESFLYDSNVSHYTFPDIIIDMNSLYAMDSCEKSKYDVICLKIKKYISENRHVIFYHNKTEITVSILSKFLSFLNFWESTGCGNMSYDYLITSSNYSIKRYFSSCFFDNYNTEVVYVQPTEFQLKTIEFFLQTNYMKLLNNKRKDLTSLLEDTVKIMSHPLLIVTPLMFEKDMCYYTNKLVELKRILDENINMNKRIAILSRNQFTLEVLSHFCSVYNKPIRILYESLNGYERMKLLEECKRSDSILLVDSNLNLMDCRLNDYNVIIIFDNGLSLNDHVIYKPLNNKSVQNNDIKIYRFITKMTIEEEYYKKVHNDKYNSSFSFLLLTLNQIFIQSLPTSIWPRTQITNSTEINSNLWNTIFKPYTQLKNDSIGKIKMIVSGDEHKTKSSKDSNKKKSHKKKLDYIEEEVDEEVVDNELLMVGRKELRLIIKYFNIHGFPEGDYSSWNIGTTLLKSKVLSKINIDTLNSFIITFMKHILSEEVDNDLSKAIDNKTLNSLLKIYYFGKFYKNVEYLKILKHYEFWDEKNDAKLVSYMISTSFEITPTIFQTDKNLIIPFIESLYYVSTKDSNNQNSFTKEMNAFYNIDKREEILQRIHRETEMIDNYNSNLKNLIVMNLQNRVNDIINACLYSNNIEYDDSYKIDRFFYNYKLSTNALVNMMMRFSKNDKIDYKDSNYSAIYRQMQYSNERISKLDLEYRSLCKSYNEKNKRVFGTYLFDASIYEEK